MILAAIYAVFAKDLLFAAVSLGVLSLAASVLFFIMNAPDLAITEAAVGAAVTTAIYVFAIRRTKREDD